MNSSNMEVDSLDDMINAFSARIRRLKNFTDKSNIKESENKTMDDKLTLYKITYTDNEKKENSTNDISLWAKDELDAEEKFKTNFDKRDRFDIDSIEVDLVLTEGCKEETITEDIVDKLRDFTPADDASHDGIKNFPNGDKPQYGEVLSGNFDASFTVGCNLEDDLVIDIILGTPEDDDFEPYSEYQYVLEVDSDDPQDIEGYVSFVKKFTEVAMLKIDKLFDAEDVDKYLMKNQFTKIHSEWDESLSLKEEYSPDDATKEFFDLMDKFMHKWEDYFEADQIVDLVRTWFETNSHKDNLGEAFALSQNIDFENEFGYAFDSDTILYAISDEKDDPELFYQWDSDSDAGYDLFQLEELLPDISIFDSISSAETYAKYDVLSEIYDNKVYIIAIKPDESTSYVKTMYK